jgi:predicted MFS family arabinose efflux permease
LSSPVLPFLLAARLLNGVGAAIIMPAAFAAAGDLPDRDRRARMIALLSAMFPLASLLGLPIGALAAIVAGWRASFLFIALVAIVALVLLSRLPATATDRSNAPAYSAAIRTVLSTAAPSRCCWSPSSGSRAASGCSSMSVSSST